MFCNGTGRLRASCQRKGKQTIMPYELTLEEIQQAELAMLDDFVRFCDSHGLRYSLVGGTLLGAVRHGGFIPWDDDIDVAMPRPDYDTFVSLAEEVRRQTGLVAKGVCGCSLRCAPLCKLSNESIIVSPAMEKEECALWIDIMPFDGLPDGPTDVARRFRKAKIIRGILLACNTKPGVGRSRFGRAARAIIRPMGRSQVWRDAWAARLNRLGKAVEYDSSTCVGVLTWGMYGTGECFPKAGLDTMTQVTFEGRRFAAMSCWDEYLTGIYGDYRQLPPREQRVNHGLHARPAEGGVP